MLLAPQPTWPPLPTAAQHRANGGKTKRPMNWAAEMDLISENGQKTDVNEIEQTCCSGKQNEEQSQI